MWFGLHRRYSTLDRHGNHQIAQWRWCGLWVRIKLVIEPDISLWRLALPIGNHVQRRWTGTAQCFHLILKPEKKITIKQYVDRRLDQNSNRKQIAVIRVHHVVISKWYFNVTYFKNIDIEVRSRGILFSLTLQKLCQLSHVEVENGLDAHQILFPKKWKYKKRKVVLSKYEWSEKKGFYSHCKNLLVWNEVFKFLNIADSEWYGRYAVVWLGVHQLDQAGWKWEHHVATDSHLASN